jgi:hypothetical protein
MISTTYRWLHLERFDCFPVFVRHRFPSARRGGPTWRPPGTASFVGPAEIMRVNDRLDVLERVPRDGRDFGHLSPNLCQARYGRPAYIMERKVVRYVRPRACLAPTRAEVVLRLRRIVRGSK